MVIKTLLVGMLMIPVSLYAQQKASLQNLKTVVEVLASDSLRGRGFNSKEIKIARSYVVSKFKEVGLKPIGESYEHPCGWHDQQFGDIDLTNVVGMIEGGDPALKDEYILLGAHYDHIGYGISDKDTVIFNGASDNATGVSGIIEIARLLTEGGVKPARSIIFVAFDGEEMQLWGSRQMVQNPPVPLEKIKAMFSLDMIGYANLFGGVKIAGVGSLKGIKIPRSLFSGSPMDVKLIKSPTFLIQNTDTGPFFKSSIPSIYVSTGLKGPYHSTKDKASTIDYQGMVHITDAMVSLTNYLSNQPSIKYTDPIPRISLGITVGVGSSYFSINKGPLNNKQRACFSLGFTTLTRLGKLTALQTDFLLTGRTSRSVNGNVFMPSLYVPVNFMLLSDYSANRFFIGAGPYYSYALHKWVGGSTVSMTSSQRYDLGANVIVGTIFFDYQVAFRGVWGLRNIERGTLASKYRSVELTVSKLLRY